MDIGIRADGMTTSDFENFAIEIVKKKFKNNSLHGFKEGKDDGIDGIDDIASPSLVIQAKRWQVTKNHTTAVKLLKEEIDKIALTKEKYGWEADFNYVIVTSMGLSPAGLKEIRDYADKIIPNAIPNDDYIIFSSTLTTLSQQKAYRDIFMNYGLLEKDITNVLRNARLKSIEAESRDYFSDFDAHYFVETRFLGEAYHILQREHILLIQGPAGIGKTTTCSMLGNLFLNNNENIFDIIVRKVEDINEVLTLYNGNYRDNEDRNLFVIFDDFLGRNKFDVGERVLQDIRKLYSASTNTNNLFICLNSRTQILQDARIVNFEFQKLIDENFIENRNFIIDLSRYSEIDRAYIFRKTFEKKLHSLGDIDKLELVGKYNNLIGKDWKRIVQHRNYFPRSIELIANNFKESSENFYDYVVYYLDHPNQLYNNLFENLKVEEKYLLFSLLQFDSLPVEEQLLKNSFHSLRLNPTFDIGRAFKKLDGSWLSFIRETFNSESKVDFFNPSIIDFLNSKLEEFPQMKHEILQKSIYLKQLLGGCKGYVDLKSNSNQIIFFNNILSNWNNFIDSSEFIGEKLVAIIGFNKYAEHATEFRRLLSSYNGMWNLTSYSNGWEVVISHIYQSNEFVIKREFLDALEDFEIVTNILESPNLDSDTIDSIAHDIDKIVEEVYYLSGFEYYASKFNEVNTFFLFKEKKIEILQDYLDSVSTIDEEDIYILETDNFDLEIEVNTQTHYFMDKIDEMLDTLYDWEGEVTLDYKGLKSNLSEYLQQKYNNLSWEDDAYDRWRDSQLEERYTIENILNKPLL
ncbi:TPA: ATP-binding protein [Streptococcus suis]|nr:ATP-binding protein [Streptococcus suis]